MQRHFQGNRYHAVAADGAVDPDHPLNKGRTGWWVTPPGVPAAGSRLLNLCGGNILTHGTLVAAPSTPMWGGTRDGLAEMSYDGSANRVSIPYNSTFDSAAFSLLATIRTTAAVVQSIIDRDPETGTRPWQFRLSAGGLVQLLKVAGGVVTAAGATACNDGKRHRIGASIDGTTTTIYVDGNADGNIAMASPSAASVGLSLGVNGSVSGGFAQYFTGQIWDVVFVSRNMTASEFFTDNRLSLLGYRVPDSPLRWVSTRTWFVPAATAGDTFPAWQGTRYIYEEEFEEILN